MKKKLFGLMMIAVMFMFPFLVSAEEVTTELELSNCVAKESATCTIKNEIALSKTIYVNEGSSIVVDLNGNKLIGPDDGAGNWYTFIVNGGTLTLKDTSEGKTGEIWAKCYGVETKTGTFIMESGKITATNNATLGAAIVNYGGKAEIKGGTLVAASNWAINVQSYFSNSELIVSGGVFEVTSEEEATVQVGGEYSKGTENVVITGGTFKGKRAFDVSTAENVNATVSITGGVFSSDVSKYLTTSEDEQQYKSYPVEDGYVIATEEDITGKVIEDEDSVATPEEFEKSLEDLKTDIKELEEEIKNLEGEEKEEALEELEIVKTFLADVEKALAGKTMVSIHDIYYLNYIGEYEITEAVTELEKAVKVTLNVPKDLAKVKEGFTRKYSVIRLHMNDKGEFEVDVLPGTLTKDGLVEFETDRFSTYVLAYEDVKDTTNPKTFDGISSIMFVAGLSLVALLAVALYAKNKKVFN